MRLREHTQTHYQDAETPPAHYTAGREPYEIFTLRGLSRYTQLDRAFQHFFLPLLFCLFVAAVAARRLTKKIRNNFFSDLSAKLTANKFKKLSAGRTQRHENDVLHRHATEGAQDITKTVSCHLAVKFVD